MPVQRRVRSENETKTPEVREIADWQVAKFKLLCAQHAEFSAFVDKVVSTCSLPPGHYRVKDIAAHLDMPPGDVSRMLVVLAKTEVGTMTSLRPRLDESDPYTGIQMYSDFDTLFRRAFGQDD